MSQATTDFMLHGSAAMLRDCGILVTGASGSGKSSVILSLITQYGATLIADDQVRVRRADEILFMTAPQRLAGLLEVSELGILRMAHTASPSPLRLWIRLEPANKIERLPPALPGELQESILDIPVPVVKLMELSPLTPLKVLLALEIVTGKRECVHDIPL
jgi:serine kinase of HPr protein (carbohydrate metabolism regulator)